MNTFKVTFTTGKSVEFNADTFVKISGDFILFTADNKNIAMYKESQIESIELVSGE